MLLDYSFIRIVLIQPWRSQRQISISGQYCFYSIFMLGVLQYITAYYSNEQFGIVQLDGQYTVSLFICVSFQACSHIHLSSVLSPAIPSSNIHSLKSCATGSALLDFRHGFIHFLCATKFSFDFLMVQFPSFHKATCNSATAKPQWPHPHTY